MKTSLDEYQKNIVQSTNNLIVIAGPGSGKSTTIKEKVNYLLNFYNEEDILLISFTNKSVNDLKEKIKSNIFITTFHKLAIDILKFNNIEYTISSDNLLDYLIDEYFLRMDISNKKMLTSYLNIKTFNTKSLEYQSLKNLIKSFINLYKTNLLSIDVLKKAVIDYKDKYLVKIIMDIYFEYEEEKKSTNSYDFDDLIIEATNILNKKYTYHKYKAIIIDEFQDTSMIRLNLIKTIYDNSSAFINVFGDDCQSIFHFSGCDLNIFLNFKNYFPNSEQVFLKNTYRNSQELIDISENFINKNKLQIVKNMHSNKSVKKPIEKVFYINPKKSFKNILDKYLEENNDTMILYRNKKDIEKYIDNECILENDYLIYKEKKFRHLTIHSSKGLESKYVIILNVADDILGLPNKIEDHSILSYVNIKDTYPFAEERRIFFVAITRCKEKTILLIPRTNPSIFIKEI